jgi:hypothetical protein
VKRLAPRLLLSVCAIVLSIASCELASRRLVAARLEAAPQIRFPRALTPLYQNERDPDLGYRLRRGASFRAVKGYSPDDVCYDVHYRIDEHGRRTVGRQRSADRPTAVLFGGSFAFGEGLRDEETLQARLSDVADVVSYATPGYGPQHMLAKIQQGTLAGEIGAAWAIGVYLMPPFHVARASAHSNQAWLFSSPHYHLDSEGVLRRAGSFWTGRYLVTRLYHWHAKAKSRSALLQVLGVDLPLRTSEREVRLAASIVRESGRAFAAEMHGPLVVVLHPWWSREGSRRHLAMLRELLPGPGLVLLDFSDWPLGAGDFIRPGCDQHPSAAFTERLAERLAPALRPILRRRPASPRGSSARSSRSASDRPLAQRTAGGSARPERSVSDGRTPYFRR